MARHAQPGKPARLITYLIVAVAAGMLWFPLGVLTGTSLHHGAAHPVATATPRPPPSHAVPARPAPPHNGRHYTVRPGDSLWSIAQAKYGHGGAWVKLWHLNRAQIPNPGSIHAGMVLRY